MTPIDLLKKKILALEEDRAEMAEELSGKIAITDRTHARIHRALTFLRQERSRLTGGPPPPKPVVPAAELELKALQGKFKKLTDFSDEQAEELKSLREETVAAVEAAAILTTSNDELKVLNTRLRKNSDLQVAQIRKLQGR